MKNGAQRIKKLNKAYAKFRATTNKNEPGKVNTLATGGIRSSVELRGEVPIAVPMKNGPWTIKKRNKVYENSYGLKVWEDEVVRPDGKKGIHGLVNIRTGVGILAVDDLGFAYLTKEFHYAVGRVGIETAAGAIDKGEKPLDAAKRELKEELGITAKEWNYLGQVDPLTTILSGPQHLFLARKLEYGDSNPEGTETISTVKIRLGDLEQKCVNGEITSALTIATVFRAVKKLKELP